MLLLLRVLIYRTPQGDSFCEDSVSSNINEVIRTVLNFLLFFYEKILHAQKSTKKHQKLKKAQKHKIATKQNQKKQISKQNSKTALKKHLSGKL